MTQVMESAGMQFLNRTHARTFTLNIFQMNALELMEATRRVRDPDQGLFLMSQQNKEAGQQAHRELSRHMHNFLAAAKTLVDHTRVFIDENYAGTHIFQNYQDQIKATFVDDGASKFVHDLRNYMLHKGMPPSRMFLHISSNPAETENPHDLETGIQLDVGSLLEWSSWTAPARRYLEAAGEHLDIHQFVEEYLVRVNRFQSWLDAMLQEHHQEDLRKLEDLRKELAIRRPFQSENRPIAGEYSEYSPVARFEFVPDHSAQLNDLANSLFSRIRELHFAKKPAPDFPTERPIAANLTEADFKGTPKFWGPDAEGVRVFAFIRKDQKIFGLTEADYNSLDGIASKVLEVEWAANSLSREFIEEAFISWSQERFESDHDTFEDALLVSAKKSVLPLEIWMPIANLEVEGGFEFGPVRIEPITSSRLDELEKARQGARPDQQEAVTKFFEKLRREIQGLAAVVVTIEAERGLAEQRAKLIAQDVVGLLRFFCPIAANSWVLCPVALLGSEIVPLSKLLIVTDTGFMMSEGVVAKHVGSWRLSIKDAERLKAEGMVTACNLVFPEKLNDFATAIRASLIVFGKGATFPDPMDRLGYTFSALEGVLLKHGLEPIQPNVADRMSFLLARTKADREEFSNTARQAYRLRERNRLAELSRQEEHLLSKFVVYAHMTLKAVLQNIDGFWLKNDFVSAVDRLSHMQPINESDGPQGV